MKTILAIQRFCKLAEKRHSQLPSWSVDLTYCSEDRDPESQGWGGVIWVITGTVKPKGAGFPTPFGF